MAARAEPARLVLGLQPVREAIRAHGPALTAVLVEQTRATAGERLRALSRFATDHGVGRIETVPRRQLDRLAAGTEHQGVAAWAPPLRLVDVATVLGAPGLLAVALDGIEDPQNFGAVVRSAVALGATAVVWPEHGAAPLTPATFRASAGAVEHATLCRVPALGAFLHEAAGAGALVVGLAPDAPIPLDEVDLRGPAVVVLGAEHRGLGGAVRRSCRVLARLEASGPVRSLNASVAAAIALYLASVSRRSTGR